MELNIVPCAPAKPRRARDVDFVALSLLNCIVEDNENEFDETRSAMMKKVFENGLLLNIISKNLSLSDLKNFRTVNTMWKNASEVHFRKKSRIIINSSDVRLCSTTEFESYYGADYRSEGSSCEIPFTSLTLQGLNPEKTSMLTNFFRNGLGKFITDLKLDTPLFMDRKKSWTDDENLDFLDISEMIPKTVKKLYLDPRFMDDSQEIHLSMSALQNVDILELRSFKLKFNGEKISPKGLKLMKTKFISENEEDEEETILINKYIDFKNLKKLVLIDKMYEVDCTEKNISLYLLRCFSSRKLLNWADSNWHIEEAIFYVENNIKGLNIHYLRTPSPNVCLTSLPIALEILSCYQLKTMKRGRNPTLPNLKAMKLKCAEEDRVLLDTRCIPKSVTILKLENNIVVCGTEMVELDTLIFKHFSEYIVEMLGAKLSKLKPKQLILSDNVLRRQPARIAVMKFMACHPNMRLSIGKLEWSHDYKTFLKPDETAQIAKSSQKPSTSTTAT